jgi:hypothetical protein
LRSPEPRVGYAMERNNHVAAAGVGLSYSGIKREANDESGDEARKRVKGSRADTSGEDPFVAAMNVAIEEYRHKDESEKRDLQDKIKMLEAQLQKDTGVKLESNALAGRSEDSTIVPDRGSPSAVSFMSVAEIKTLKDTVIDLSAANESLLTKLRRKNEKLRDKRELLDTEKDKNSNLRAELSSANRGLHRKNHDLALCAKEHGTENIRVTDVDDYANRLGKLLHDAEDEKQTMKDQLEELRRANAQLLQPTDTRLHELEHEVTETKRRIRAEHAVQVKKLSNRNFNDRVMDGAKYAKKIKEMENELKECQRNLKGRENSKSIWKERTNDMYIAYQGVYDKNEKLVKKLGKILKAGSFESGLNAKDRKMLDELRSCPLDELSAFQED